MKLQLVRQEWRLSFNRKSSRLDRSKKSGNDIRKIINVSLLLSLALLNNFKNNYKTKGNIRKDTQRSKLVQGNSCRGSCKQSEPIWSRLKIECNNSFRSRGNMKNKLRRYMLSLYSLSRAGSKKHNKFCNKIIHWRHRTNSWLLTYSNLTSF